MILILLHLVDLQQVWDKAGDENNASSRENGPIITVKKSTNDTLTTKSRMIMLEIYKKAVMIAFEH